MFTWKFQKSDWKLFRARIGDWQETYMERLVARLLLLVKDRQEKGVQVTVITTDPEEVVYGSADVCYGLINEMKQVGINVVTKSEVEERFAVIDDELVWHGGMNLLGKVDIWDNLMRIKNYLVAAELLEISLGTTTESEGG